MVENQNIEQQQKIQQQVTAQNGKDFISSFKEKYYSVLKYLLYYIVVLFGIFILINLTDFFSYKTIFSNSQVVLYNGLNLVKQYNPNNVNDNELKDVLDAKYGTTAKGLKDFFSSKDVVGYFCVNTEGTIKKINASKIIANVSGISETNSDPKTIDRIMGLVLATDYAYCGRDSNLYKVYYNKIYSGNVLTDILNINVKGTNEDHIYKYYKFLKYYYPSANIIKEQMEQTIIVYYPDLAKKLGLNEKSQTTTETNSSIDMILYSPETLLVNSTINLFPNEITNSKIWYDGNDGTNFFSKLSLISDSFYDLGVFNIKGTIKYTFDAILYNIPIVRYMYLNITFFILAGILTTLMFLLIDLLPMSLLSFGNYFNLEDILFSIATFFYTLIYYFVEIIVVIYILSKVIGFFINIS